MITKATRTFEFNNIPVTFLVTPHEVLVNARDLLNIEYAEVLLGTNEELFESVYESLHGSDYDHNWCVIDASDKKKIVIWLRVEFAISFAAEMSEKLAKWCKKRFKKLDNQRAEIVTTENSKSRSFYESRKEPALDDYYECDWSDKPHEGLTQTFHYRGEAVSLCVDDNEILVNTTQMLRIFKKERKEWLALKEADSVQDACAARGHTVACCYGKDKDVYSIWTNITIAEHLALWLEKKPDFKLWLQDRASELKFFSKTANRNTICAAFGDMDYLRTNCVIDRD